MVHLKKTLLIILILVLVPISLVRSAQAADVREDTSNPSGALTDSIAIGKSLPAHGSSDTEIGVQGIEGLIPVTGEAPPPILPPPGFLESYLKASESGAGIQSVSYDLDFVGEWSAEEKNAMLYAVSIWSEFINSPVPITIQVEWVPQASFLGQASLSYLTMDDPKVLKPGNFYLYTLANALTGEDLRPNSPDMIIRFARNHSWYVGIDGQTPNGKWDMVSVAMHEIGHGLLGVPSYYVSGTLGAWGSIFYWPEEHVIPRVNDWFIVNGSGQNLIDTTLFPNPSTALFNQLMNSELYFSGPYTLEYNNNQGGMLDRFSLGHVHYSYSGTANALMRSSLTDGEVTHHPGPVVLGMLKDLGWEVAINTAPRVGPLGSVMLEMNGNKLGALDLWMSSSDTFSSPSELTYSILNTPAAEAGISLRETRYIDIAPALDWLGSTQVQIQVQDPEGLSSTSSFWVIVVEKVYTLVLPVTYKVGK